MKASPALGPSRSILSKFKGPFSSKQHPQIRQEIHPDNPYREYAPGDSVKGKIVLDVPKPVRATHLVVRLHGFVKVVTHSRLPGEPIPYDENLLYSTKGRRAGEYFGNGFAKLFEDEHVLCGDGLLYGRYEFSFEVILPSSNIPSSIDFENGTITYSLTSTLTRPTTIAPTLVEHYKVKVKENIDIARTPKPRPQTVSLETVKSRRPVMHMKRKFSASNKSKETTGSHLESGPSHTLDPGSVIDAPRSPGLSEIESIASAESNSTSNTRSGTNVPAATDSRSMSSGLFSMSSVERTITAQTEVLQGGCLPGDTLNIRVSVDHTKPIKSMQGVLITFYRLARIDTHPAIPLGPSNGNNNARYEDYYPRSRTGLGGLSLSSAGSSRTFRQDLAQHIAPLIVDPHTLTAILRTTVQVPDHIFPSISGVPGSMISFKYFVEVIIDLRGKLGQDRLSDKLSLTNTPQHSYEDPKINLVDRDNGVTFSSTPGFNFLVTDQIRRQKGIVYTRTEVLVGTRDTARSNAKQKSREPERSDQERTPQTASANGQLPKYYSNGDHASEVEHSSYYHNGHAGYGPRHPDIVPPASFQEPMDEKARIRQAEMTLLPSAPPDQGDSSTTDYIGPSAPVALDEEDFHNRYNLQGPAPRYEAVTPVPIARQNGDVTSVKREGWDSSNGLMSSTIAACDAPNGDRGDPHPELVSGDHQIQQAMPNGKSGSNHSPTMGKSFIAERSPEHARRGASQPAPEEGAATSDSFNQSSLTHDDASMTRQLNPPRHILENGGQFGASTETRLPRANNNISSQAASVSPPARAESPTDTDRIPG